MSLHQSIKDAISVCEAKADYNSKDSLAIKVLKAWQNSRKQPFAEDLLKCFNGHVPDESAPEYVVYTAVTEHVGSTLAEDKKSVLSIAKRLLGKGVFSSNGLTDTYKYSRWNKIMSHSDIASLSGCVENLVSIDALDNVTFWNVLESVSYNPYEDLSLLQDISKLSSKGYPNIIGSIRNADVLIVLATAKRLGYLPNNSKSLSSFITRVQGNNSYGNKILSGETVDALRALVKSNSHPGNDKLREMQMFFAQLVFPTELPSMRGVHISSSLASDMTKLIPLLEKFGYFKHNSTISFPKGAYKQKLTYYVAVRLWRDVFKEKVDSKEKQTAVIFLLTFFIERAEFFEHSHGHKLNPPDVTYNQFCDLLQLMDEHIPGFVTLRTGDDPRRFSHMRNLLYFFNKLDGPKGEKLRGAYKDKSGIVQNHMLFAMYALCHSELVEESEIESCFKLLANDAYRNGILNMARLDVLNSVNVETLQRSLFPANDTAITTETDVNGTADIDYIGALTRLVCATQLESEQTPEQVILSAAFTMLAPCLRTLPNIAALVNAEEPIESTTRLNYKLEALFKSIQDEDLLEQFKQLAACHAVTIVYAFMLLQDACLLTSERIKHFFNYETSLTLGYSYQSFTKVFLIKICDNFVAVMNMLQANGLRITELLVDSALAVAENAGNVTEQVSLLMSLYGKGLLTASRASQAARVKEPAKIKGRIERLPGSECTSDNILIDCLLIDNRDKAVALFKELAKRTLLTLDVACKAECSSIGKLSNIRKEIERLDIFQIPVDNILVLGFFASQHPSALVDAFILARAEGILDKSLKAELCNISMPMALVRARVKKKQSLEGYMLSNTNCSALLASENEESIRQCFNLLQRSSIQRNDNLDMQIIYYSSPKELSAFLQALVGLRMLSALQNEDLALIFKQTSEQIELRVKALERAKQLGCEVIHPNRQRAEKEPEGTPAANRSQVCVRDLLAHEELEKVLKYHERKGGFLHEGNRRRLFVGLLQHKNLSSLDERYALLTRLEINDSNTICAVTEAVDACDVLKNIAECHPGSLLNKAVNLSDTHRLSDEVLADKLIEHKSPITFLEALVAMTSEQTLFLHSRDILDMLLEATDPKTLTINLSRLCQCGIPVGLYAHDIAQSNNPLNTVMILLPLSPVLTASSICAIASMETPRAVLDARDVWIKFRDAREALLIPTENISYDKAYVKSLAVAIHVLQQAKLFQASDIACVYAPQNADILQQLTIELGVALPAAPAVEEEGAQQFSGVPDTSAKDFKTNDVAKLLRLLDVNAILDDSVQRAALQLTEIKLFLQVLQLERLKTLCLGADSAKSLLLENFEDICNLVQSQFLLDVQKVLLANPFNAEQYAEIFKRLHEQALGVELKSAFQMPENPGQQLSDFKGSFSAHCGDGDSRVASSSSATSPAGGTVYEEDSREKKPGSPTLQRKL